MTAQQQLKHENCPHLYGAFLVESIWFLFWWCPLLAVDCFRKRCLPGTPSGNSQAGWNLWNRMARGYRFDAKWVCPMGSYTWGIQVFCSRNEAPPQESWRFTYFCKSYCQRKIGIFLWATLYIEKNLKCFISFVYTLKINFSMSYVSYMWVM